MPSFPRDLPTEREHTRRRAGNDTLACVNGRLEMDVDAQREVEAPLAGRSDQRRELDAAHEPQRASAPA